MSQSLQLPAPAGGDPTRRELVAAVGGGLACGGLLLAAGCAAPSPESAMQTQPPAAAPPAPRPGLHEVQPLPFDPAKLRDLSQRLMVSHHDNNYPPFLVAGLRERELVFTNSMILHEAYFGNLGGDGKPGGPAADALAAAHGGLDRWEQAFRAAAAGLYGGSGWVVVDANLHVGALHTYATGGHPFSVAAGLPVLVLDMYEHAYALDYGASAGDYVNAFFRNVQWDEVNRRHERAGRALAALRG